MNVNTSLIPPPNRRDDLVKNDYDTGDIVKEVLDTYKDTKGQLAAFAPQLRGNSDLETCRKIFEFIKKNIRYRIDPSGVQWVQTPARLWANKVGDCKSYSIFAAACLYNLGIPGCFRFVSYNKSPIPTHVYVVAYPGGKEIKIDAVLSGFNTENQYTHKIDYDMNSLYRLSGIEGIGSNEVIDPQYATGQPVYDPKPGEFMLPVMADGTTTDALVEAAILKQRLEIEAAMMARVSGIGSDAVAVAQQVIAELDARIKEGISGVDDPALGKKKKGIFRKIANVAKKVVLAPVKIAQKIVTAPLAIILNIRLPKAAMGFLYIFIPEGQCEKLGPVICQKRAKQLKVMKTLSNIVAMKESHFRGLIENGIMKQTGKTPLAYLSEQFKTAIGQTNPLLNATPGEKLGVASVVIGFVLTLVRAVTSLFKKKDKELDENNIRAMVMDPSDWQNVQFSEQERLMLNRSVQPGKLEQVLNAAQAGINVVNSARQAFNDANGMQSVESGYYDTDYSQYSSNVPSSVFADQQQQQAFLPQSQTQLPPQPQGPNINTLALVGLGFLGLMMVVNKR